MITITFDTIKHPDGDIPKGTLINIRTQNGTYNPVPPANNLQSNNMTPNLTKIIEKAASLPAVIQDEIALQWLDDIENELRWQTTLEQPQSKLEHLALAALQQAKQGKTIKKGFDEL